MRLDDLTVLGVPGALLDRTNALPKLGAMVRAAVAKGQRVILLVGGARVTEHPAGDGHRLVARVATAATANAHHVAETLEAFGVLASMGSGNQLLPKTRGGLLSAEPRRVDVRALLKTLGSRSVLVLPAGVGIDAEAGDTRRVFTGSSIFDTRNEARMFDPTTVRNGERSVISHSKHFKGT